MKQLKWIELQDTNWVLVSKQTSEICDELTFIIDRWRWYDEGQPVNFLSIIKAKKYIKKFRESHDKLQDTPHRPITSH